jgi:mono/diheme cytochrome c family protein
VKALTLSPIVRRARRWLSASLVLGAAVMLSAPAAYSFPWDIDMYRGQAVQPLSRAPRVMPEDTLPTHGMPAMSLEMMTVKLKNPLQPSPENIAHGKVLFDNLCAACHGDDGRGDGPVAKAGLLKHVPKNLVTGTAKDLPDGYIYAAIRNGILLMPAYKDAMSSDERWEVVMYVRELEKAAEQKKTAQK